MKDNFCFECLPIPCPVSKVTDDFVSSIRDGDIRGLRCGGCRDHRFYSAPLWFLYYNLRQTPVKLG